MLGLVGGFIAGAFAVLIMAGFVLITVLSGVCRFVSFLVRIVARRIDAGRGRSDRFG